ncbi:MAG: TetR/AcrR family transcriptional regulator, partial [Ramlibacter sp.]
MDAKTQKSEMTRAAIVGAGLDIASEQGLEAITLQAVADRIGLSKSGVFSRIGSREALQKAAIDEFGRRFLAQVFVPAMQAPKGLPRLNEVVQRWIVRTRDV